MVDTKYGRMKKIMPRHLDNDKPMKTHHADDETLEYIASLEQKNAELEKDARRYRWLRDTSDRDDDGSPYIALDNWLDSDDDDDSPEDAIQTSWLQGDEADSAIDAALKDAQ